MNSYRKSAIAFVLFIAMLLVSNVAIAASPEPTTRVTEIVGSVIDDTAAAVAEAQIVIRDARGKQAGLQTDAAGLFVYRTDVAQPLSAGALTISARKLGFRDVSTVVSAPSGQAQDITLVLRPTAATPSPSRTPLTSSQKEQSTVAKVDADSSRASDGWNHWWTLLVASVAILTCLFIAAGIFAEHNRNRRRELGDAGVGGAQLV